MIAQLYGLRGAPRIVLDEMERAAEAGEQVSVTMLSDKTNYHRVTVWRTLRKLCAQGLVLQNQEGGYRWLPLDKF